MVKRDIHHLTLLRKHGGLTQNAAASLLGKLIHLEVRADS